MKLTVKNKINPLKYRKILNNRALWIFGSTQWHTLYSPFIPMDSGKLMSDVRIEPKRIIYLVPYAKRQYYSNAFNFRTDRHSKATYKWDKAAKSTQFRKLIQSMNKYIKVKGLLNG